MTAEEIAKLVAEIRDHHYVDDALGDCKRCEQDWPCPASRAADALEACAKDTERLDFIESEESVVLTGFKQWTWRAGLSDEFDTNGDLRSAIDSARKGARDE
jgi:hypothetical protein